MFISLPSSPSSVPRYRCFHSHQRPVIAINIADKRLAVKSKDSAQSEAEHNLIHMGHFHFSSNTGRGIIALELLVLMEATETSDRGSAFQETRVQYQKERGGPCLFLFHAEDTLAATFPSRKHERQKTKLKHTFSLWIHWLAKGMNLKKQRQFRRRPRGCSETRCLGSRARCPRYARARRPRHENAQNKANFPAVPECQVSGFKCQVGKMQVSTLHT